MPNSRSTSMRVRSLAREISQDYAFKTPFIQVELDPDLSSEAAVFREEAGVYKIKFARVYPSDETVIHELAHIVLWEKYGVFNHEGHGPAWMRVFEDLEEAYL